MLHAAAKSLQSCPTLCDSIDGSPPGSLVPGILQARTLKWISISFSNAWKWKVKGKSLSRVQLFTTPWTAAYQAPLSMGFSRQEYWSGVPSPWKSLRHVRFFVTPWTLQSMEFSKQEHWIGLVPLYGWIIFCLSIHPPIDIWIFFFFFWLLGRHLKFFCFPLWFITRYWV